MQEVDASKPTLRQARAYEGKRQCKLELETGIKQSVISLFENGYRKPSAEQKKKLAEALGYKTDQINWCAKS